MINYSYNLTNLPLQYQENIRYEALLSWCDTISFKLGFVFIIMFLINWGITTWYKHDERFRETVKESPKGYIGMNENIWFILSAFYILQYLYSKGISISTTIAYALLIIVIIWLIYSFFKNDMIGYLRGLFDDE